VKAKAGRPEVTPPCYIDVGAWLPLAAIAIMAVSCTQSAASAGLVRDDATSALIQQYKGSTISLPLAYWRRFASAIHHRSASL
jgi:hypothetical protein